MDAMDWKADPTIDETSNLKIEPAFGVALVNGPLSVDCSPDTVVIIGCAFDLSHVAGVEETAKEDAGLAWLGEVEFVALGDEVGVGFGQGRRGGLHGIAY